MTRPAIAATVMFALIAADTLAQAAPRIPSSAMPGRERERFIDQPFPPTPRIQLQDGRPAPVITPAKPQPSKRKRRTRSSKTR